MKIVCRTKMNPVDSSQTLPFTVGDHISDKFSPEFLNAIPYSPMLRGKIIQNAETGKSFVAWSPGRSYRSWINTKTSITHNLHLLSTLGSLLMVPPPATRMDNTFSSKWRAPLAIRSLPHTNSSRLYDLNDIADILQREESAGISTGIPLRDGFLVDTASCAMINLMYTKNTKRKSVFFAPTAIGPCADLLVKPGELKTIFHPQRLLTEKELTDIIYEHHYSIIALLDNDGIGTSIKYQVMDYFYPDINVSELDVHATMGVDHV